MKTDLWVDEDQSALFIKVEAENQEESSNLVTWANRTKLPVKTLGEIGRTTWVWFKIPLKKENFEENYFGNDRS